MATKGERANVVTLPGELTSHRGCICKRGPVSAAHRRVVSTFVVLRPPHHHPPNPPRPRIIDAISKICRYENRKSFFISLVGAYGVWGGTHHHHRRRSPCAQTYFPHMRFLLGVCVCVRVRCARDYIPYARSQSKRACSSTLHTTSCTQHNIHMRILQDAAAHLTSAMASFLTVCACARVWEICTTCANMCQTKRINGTQTVDTGARTHILHL